MPVTTEVTRPSTIDDLIQQQHRDATEYQLAPDQPRPAKTIRSATIYTGLSTDVAFTIRRGNQQASYEAGYPLTVYEERTAVDGITKLCRVTNDRVKEAWWLKAEDLEFNQELESELEQQFPFQVMVGPFSRIFSVPFYDESALLSSPYTDAVVVESGKNAQVYETRKDETGHSFYRITPNGEKPEVWILTNSVKPIV